MSNELTAENLKNALWDTLKCIKSGQIQPAQGDAIAAQAREILRTVKVQQAVSVQTKRNLPTEVINFAESIEK